MISGPIPKTSSKPNFPPMAPYPNVIILDVKTVNLGVISTYMGGSIIIFLVWLGISMSPTPMYMLYLLVKS